MIKSSNWRTVQVVCFSARRDASIDRSVPCSPRKRTFAASQRTDDSKTCVCVCGGGGDVCVWDVSLQINVEELFTVIHQEPHLYAFVVSWYVTNDTLSPSSSLLSSLNCLIVWSFINNNPTENVLLKSNGLIMNVLLFSVNTNPVPEFVELGSYNWPFPSFLFAIAISRLKSFS
jgi:hypothetical protein